MFQRLREWYLNAKQKRGNKRRDLDVTKCFAPLLGWALRLWKSETRHLALVMDATTLGKRWTILTISVVVRSCAIPVAMIGLARRARRVLASVLGRTVDLFARGRSSRVGSAGASRSGIVCALALGDDPGVWVASVFAH